MNNTKKIIGQAVPLLLLLVLAIVSVLVINMTNTVVGQALYEEHYETYIEAEQSSLDLTPRGFIPPPPGLPWKLLDFANSEHTGYAGGVQFPNNNGFFRDATYIPNKNFFIRNPMHMHNNPVTESNPDGNPKLPSIGACTTVAAQLMLSYHNFFTDRRIIPEMHNGQRFLHADYGNLGYWPDSRVGMGERNELCYRIGATNEMFWDMFGRTPPPIHMVATQFPMTVRRTMQNFLDAHYRDIHGRSLSGNVNIGYTVFQARMTRQVARAEIDAGRPIVLGFPTNFDINFGLGIIDDIQNSRYHQVVAFGHAYVDGVFGFIVHYGWQNDYIELEVGDGIDPECPENRRPSNHAWLPACRFDNYIRMEVRNAPGRVATGRIHPGVNMTYDILVCSARPTQEFLGPVLQSRVIPGTRNVEVGAREGVPLPANLVIPSTVFVSGVQHTVTRIAAEGFLGNTDIRAVTIPSSVRYIGDEAFYRSSVDRVVLSEGLVSIGYFALAHTQVRRLVLPSSNVILAYTVL